MGKTTKTNRELVDAFVLQIVRIEYDTNPRDGESIDFYIDGILDKVEDEYEVEGSGRRVRFNLSNIKKIELDISFFKQRTINIYLV